MAPKKTFEEIKMKYLKGLWDIKAPEKTFEEIAREYLKKHEQDIKRQDRRYKEARQNS